MVFRGKPSKACERCRSRRLKCDFGVPSCGACIRAQVCCTGYRDTQQLRVRNESQTIERKAHVVRIRPSSEPRSLALSLESRARDSFFAYYVINKPKTWDFLEPLYGSNSLPDYLRLSLDAASLAYLSHQASSGAAMTVARERYVRALHTLNIALKIPKTATKDRILLASLLLDLFEKITNHEPRRDKSWSSHCHGAITLVKLRGVENFQNKTSLRIFLRLSTNIIISCAASETPVPAEMNALRAYAEKRLNTDDPKWRLSGLMIQYANLRSDIRYGILSNTDSTRRMIELDAKLAALTIEIPTGWQHKTTFVKWTSDRNYNDYFNVFPERHVTQTWNVLRLVRILLNEYILEKSSSSAEDLIPETGSQFGKDYLFNIHKLADEICASAPQYTNCSGAMSPQAFADVTKPPRSTCCVAGQHTASQLLDCYTLIYPLYVAGKGCVACREWVVGELFYMASHFGIRNAAVVGKILENRTESNPWAVYALLGGYAFAA